MKTAISRIKSISAALLSALMLLAITLGWGVASASEGKSGSQPKHSSMIAKSDNGKRGNESNNSSHKRVFLKKSDENMINRKINEIQPYQRLDFLMKVLERITKLESNISNSNMTNLRKTRFLGLLDEIRDLVQTKIDQINNESGSGSLDTMPPVISSLTLTGITAQSAMLTANVSESGRGYYVVLQSGSTAPSASQVRLGENANGALAQIRWSMNTSTGSNQFVISGLSPETGYMAYFTARDTSGNLQTMVASVAFSTLSTPVFDSIAPSISSLTFTWTTSTGTTLSVTVNESGSGYYILSLSGALAPSALQVKLGQDGSGQMALLHGSGATSSGTNMFPLTGLASDTKYRVYFTAQDMSGNLQQTPQNAELTTLAP